MILQTLILSDGTSFELTGDTWAAFGEAYQINAAGVDQHCLFAELLDVNREVAKEISWRMMYTNNCIKRIVRITKYRKGK